MERKRRKRLSCDSCYARKVKCDLEQPCTSCSRSRRDCVYSGPVSLRSGRHRRGKLDYISTSAMAESGIISPTILEAHLDLTPSDTEFEMDALHRCKDMFNENARPHLPFDLVIYHAQESRCLRQALLALGCTFSDMISMGSYVKQCLSDLAMAADTFGLPELLALILLWEKILELDSRMPLQHWLKVGVASVRARDLGDHRHKQFSINVLWNAYIVDIHYAWVFGRKPVLPDLSLPLPTSFDDFDLLLPPSSCHHFSMQSQYVAPPINVTLEIQALLLTAMTRQMLIQNDTVSRQILERSLLDWKQHRTSFSASIWLLFTDIHYHSLQVAHNIPLLDHYLITIENSTNAVLCYQSALQISHYFKSFVHQSIDLPRIPLYVAKAALNACIVFSKMTKYHDVFVKAQSHEELVFITGLMEQWAVWQPLVALLISQLQ
ncbi:hypothetical protein EDD86DRAFT_207894 [Gorgonomyces haynaldii]|nr:hypothetical protein EDD86DRAFT_207894 [Gorgonomyces haynaldii]